MSARVVRTRNGRSRGYGFVEFANEEQQKKAMEEKQGYKVGPENASRPIAISISSSAPEAQEESQTQQ